MPTRRALIKPDSLLGQNEVTRGLGSELGYLGQERGEGYWLQYIRKKKVGIFCIRSKLIVKTACEIMIQLNLFSLFIINTF